MSKRIPPGMRRVMKTERGWTIYLDPLPRWGWGNKDERVAKPSYHYSSDRNLIEKIALDAIREHQTISIIINPTGRVWEEDEAIP